MTLDLQFRLEFLHQKVQMSNFHTKVSGRRLLRSRPNSRGPSIVGGRSAVQRLPWSEGLGKCSWPGRSGVGRGQVVEAPPGGALPALEAGKKSAQSALKVLSVQPRARASTFRL